MTPTQYIKESENEFANLAYPIVKSEILGDEKALERLKSFLLSRQKGLLDLIRKSLPKENGEIEVVERQVMKYADNFRASDERAFFRKALIEIVYDYRQKVLEILKGE